MKSLEKNQNLSAGEQKIEEYVSRIKSGESKDSIFQDLPESFKSGIEKKLAEPAKEKAGQDTDKIPPQYKGLNFETLDFIWTIPEYLDLEKTKELKEQKVRALASLREKEITEKTKEERHQVDQEKISELREQLGIARPSENAKIQEQKEALSLSVEERKKLSGWAASYELAKIAKQQGIDLTKLPREDYAQFAIYNSLAIDDDQLRMATWERMVTSPEGILAGKKENIKKIKPEAEKAFARFSFEAKKKAGEQNRFMQEGIRVRQGTGSSNSWLFFGINNSPEEGRVETYKSYVSVKDLNILTPERFSNLMATLRDAGYNGDIKIFQDLSEQGILLNDQIVMHGSSHADAELALQVAEKFFGADLDQKGVGKDEVIDGKDMSHSQILAKKIADTINPSKTKN